MIGQDFFWSVPDTHRWSNFWLVPGTHRYPKYFSWLVPGAKWYQNMKISSKIGTQKYPNFRLQGCFQFSGKKLEGGQKNISNTFWTKFSLVFLKLIEKINKNRVQNLYLWISWFVWSSLNCSENIFADYLDFFRHFFTRLFSQFAILSRSNEAEIAATLDANILFIFWYASCIKY